MKQLLITIAAVVLVGCGGGFNDSGTYIYASKEQGKIRERIKFIFNKDGTCEVIWLNTPEINQGFWELKKDLIV